MWVSACYTRVMFWIRDAGFGVASACLPSAVFSLLQLHAPARVRLKTVFSLGFDNSMTNR